jgi:hypothetical protein
MQADHRLAGPAAEFYKIADPVHEPQPVAVARIQLRTVIRAQDTDPGSGERHVDQGLVPDRLALLGAGASRPRQLLQETDRLAG